MSTGFVDPAMTSTLLDTNILIDFLGGGPFSDASRNAVLDASQTGPLVLSAVVWAELAFGMPREGELWERVAWLRPVPEPLPFAAAFPAGQAHRLYRQRGGRRDRTLPDFLIGAHALVAGHRLLTRDAGRYRTHFPNLDIICPETHP